MQLEQELKEKTADIEKLLERMLPEEAGLQKTIFSAMRYSLMAGGKRIRPLLIAETYRFFGGTDMALAEPFMAAIEMIHTYSLIHDDLPAMDNDDYRRGKLTNHKVYGAGLATLAGDALLTLAFEVLLRQPGVSDATRLAVVREMATAAGMNGMVGGQAIDLASEGHRIPMELLKKMHMGKTGALFRAAIRSGAILGGADDAQLAALTRYADAFGLAFQITDDILDVVGDEAAIGKPVGSDERNHKSTYVTLLSLEKAQALAPETVDDAISALDGFGDEAAFLRGLVQMLIERNH